VNLFASKEAPNMIEAEFWLAEFNNIFM